MSKGLVLVTFHEPDVGGASRSVLRAMAPLSERGWDFRLWAPHPSPLFDHLRAEGHDVAGAPRELFFSLQTLRHAPGPRRRLVSVGPYTRALGGFLRRVKPDIVHANSLFCLPEALLARTFGLRTLLHVHEMPPVARKATAVRLLTSAAGVRLIGVSRASADWLGNADVVHESAPLPPASPMRCDDTAPLTVVCIGAISRRKGSDVFVEAARLVLADRPEVRFRLIGAVEDNFDARWGEEVVGRARRAGIDYDERADVPSLLDATDIFVLPSRRDPFPLAVLEAMGHGLPVVATAVDGLVEQVTPETGILTAPEDPRALADAIIVLVDDVERRRALGRAGRERLATQFTPEHQADALEAVYRSLLAAK